MKKISIIIVLCFVFFNCICLTVFSQSDTEYSEFESLFNSQEYELIDDVINDSNLFGGEIPNNAATYSINETTDNTAYKLYSFSADDLIDAYNNGNSISNYLPENYDWIVEKSGSFVKVVLKNGEWQAVGYTTYPQDSNQTDVIDTADFEQKLSTLQSENNDKTVDVAFFKIAQIYTSFAYISAGEKEYLIPYGSRPDFTGLENGKLYTVAEVAEKVIAASAENDIDTEMNVGGFLSASDDSSSSTVKYIIITIGVGVVFLSIVFIFVKKRNSKSI